MSIRKALVTLALVAIPVLTQSEVVYLKDGSSLKGTVRRFQNDTLYFKTSFGSVIRVPREKIARIDFGDSIVVPQQSMKAQPVPEPAGPGYLAIEFDNVEVSSTILMHRNRDREGHERENTIETVLLVDNQLVYSAIDTTTDKVIKDGTDTKLRNKAKPESFTVEIASGTWDVALIIGNTRVDQYRDRFDSKPIDYDVKIDNVLIKPGATKRFRIGMRKKKLGLAGKELVIR